MGMAVARPWFNERLATPRLHCRQTHDSPLQAILDRVMEGAGGSSRQPFAPPPAALAHTTGTDTSSPAQQYCLGALEGLIERAAAYSRLGQPIKWGWCRWADP